VDAMPGPSGLLLKLRAQRPVVASVVRRDGGVPAGWGGVVGVALQAITKCIRISKLKLQASARAEQDTESLH
jgi:hypothetical protein